MNFVTFYIDGREWTAWAKVLTSTTTDATLLVDDWNLRTAWVFLVYRNHLDGTSRTVAGTVATRLLVGQHYTALLNPNGMANLRRRLLFQGQWLDGTCRTNLGATVTLWTAVAILIA